MNRKQAYIDKSGKIVIPPKYDSGSDLKNGEAVVKIGKQVFFIDKSGKESKFRKS